MVLKGKLLKERSFDPSIKLFRFNYTRYTTICLNNVIFTSKIINELKNPRNRPEIQIDTTIDNNNKEAEDNNNFEHFCWR